jgi:uncharacterized BrkB/YihY/UPF0761 family membrane protein
MELKLNQSEVSRTGPEIPSTAIGVKSAGAGNPFRQLRIGAWPTLKYLTQTEVHTYAFSVAANAILSFFPFFVLMMTLARRVFHSQRMYDAIKQLLMAYLPTSQDFIVSTLSNLARAQHGVQIVSLVMLLITCTGVFLPLEVALNRVWGFHKNRSYLMNQLVALGLALACGVLALASSELTASNFAFLERVFRGHTQNLVFRIVARVVTESLAGAASIAIFFLPWLDFKEVYGPFYVSVSLIFWGFLWGLLLLGGAHLSAVGRVPQGEDPERDIV